MAMIPDRAATLATGSVVFTDRLAEPPEVLLRCMRHAVVSQPLMTP